MKRLWLLPEIAWNPIPYGYETIAEAEEKALAAKYEEGVGFGVEKGIGIGMESERREMAKGFRDAGISLELIARQTGLSEEEIRKL